jgi:hypothetical protein
MLKKLKSLFIIDEESPAQNTASSGKSATSEPDVDTGSSGREEVSLKDYVPSETPGKPDPKFVDVLLKAIEAANKEGFDYLEYKTSLQSLQKMDMDEATRFKSAFVMAKTLGLTKEKLLQSTDFYINILKSEEKKFKDALINQKEKQVKGREMDLKTIEKSMADKQAMIEKLKAEIEAGQQQLSQIKAEISEAVQKIDSTNEQFMIALHSVLDQITEDRSKIQNYLE